MADMIGCLVYRGKVYVQGESYTGRELEKAEGLVGEYLGEAKAGGMGNRICFDLFRFCLYREGIRRRFPSLCF